MDEERKQIINKYRKVFLSPLGREVLTDILTMCHFGKTLDSANLHQVAEYNVGVAILAKMGIFAEGTMMNLLNAMATVIPNFKEKEREE